MKRFWCLLLGMIMFSTQSLAVQQPLPDGFVFLTDIDPTIIESVRYYGPDNFMAKPVPGYTVNRIITTEKAAVALKAVHEGLKKQGYQLVVYDGYRSQRSVDAFLDWRDTDDDEGKAQYYPTLTKQDIFELGYISPHSEHTRGSTFDLTLIKSGEHVTPIRVTERTLSNDEIVPFLDDNTIDMGSSFDLFHDASHQHNAFISQKGKQHRQILRSAMIEGGFMGYAQEWWHYRLIDEPFPDTYFNFSAIP